MGPEQRNYGIDLLRILAMLLIIMHHLFCHGGFYNSVIQGNTGGGYATIAYICGFGINCFALISGYVGFRAGYAVNRMLYAKRIHKLFQLWFQVLFFSVGLFFLFGPELSAHDYFPSLIKSLLPVSSKQYWYFSSYVGVFLIAPGLNLVAKNLAEYIGGNKTRKLVLFSIVILICLMWSDPFGFSDGYSSAWLTYLYLIGAVIYTLGIDKSISKTFIIIALIITVFTVAFFSRSSIYMLPVDILTERTLPTMLVPSIMVLVLFSKISVRSSRGGNIIIWISSSVFAIYLLHDNRFFRETFISNKFSIEAIGSVNPLLYMFAISVLIFMAGILLDKFRLLLFNKTLIARLSNYVISRGH